MNRNDNHDDLIDLGTASIETLGLPTGDNDEHAGQKSAGLSND